MKDVKQIVQWLNDELRTYLERLHAPETLKEAMKYSLLAGGKRIRPLLIFATLEAFQKPPSLGLPVACAVEMIHTYSLIHDDLPAMDDDDYRRGKLTNHKVFGEATAILSGDALLTYSFQVLAEAASIPTERKLQLIAELARAAGPEGMVAGQIADLAAENKQVDLEQLEYIHLHKTGKLLAFCIKAGAILAGADELTIKKMDEFAHHIGLAFQIRDDVLDIIGSTEQMGKRAGSDVSKNKSTYPKLLTLEGAKEKLNDHLDLALEILNQLPLDTRRLKELTELIVHRAN